ncbi:MAG: hypothetical protein E4G90_07245 [Gemmatimonadales bacterium]|nr:MAG: hypothetical protein E4G90_07245 [Gemmatimonadales bacterium]
MSIRFVRLFGLSALLGGLVSARETGPSEPLPNPDAEVEAALGLMAAEANSAGDHDAADGFSGGALALRLGIRPTEIAVSVNGETARYWAVVAGIAHTLRGGPSVLKRSLIAWTAGDDRRPTAILQVSLLTDEASFAFPTDLLTAADPRGRARGTWVDLVQHLRFVAISGAAGIVVAETTDDPCDGALGELPGLRCVKATYDMHADGRFAALLTRDARTADETQIILIQTAAQGVNGIFVSPILSQP